ncbi:integrase catalytic domain-containing protein [Pseudomonas fluorescens]|nr:DDE-type integrase/transposase/recombinase [Pseudomonas fluorescens]
MPKDFSVPVVGAQYLIDGIVHEVIQIDDELVTLSNVTRLRVISLPFGSFMTDLKRRNITLFADKPGRGSNAIAFLHPGDSKVIEAKRKFRYISTALREQGNCLPEATTKAIIQRIAGETHDPHPPGYSTLCKWIARFRANNNDEFSLYKPPSTLPRGRKLAVEIQDKLDNLINEEYLKRDERITVHRLFQLLKGYVVELNRQRAGGLEPLLRAPCRSTVVRAIAKRIGYATDHAHLGAEAAYQRHRFSGEQERPGAPLEICEIDSHVLDMVVVDKAHRILGKIAYLTVIFELHSEMVIGWELSLTIPCAEKTLRALRMAVVAVPGEEYQRGAMELLVSDGGSETKNSFVATVLDRLGIKWTLPPPKSPNTRARIERFFETFESWLHEQYGTTFSNPDACADYDSARHACYTIEVLVDYFREWLEDVYHTTKHRTLNMPPRIAWERAMQNQLPPRKFAPEALDALFRGIEFSALSGNRAQFFGLTWTGPNLGTIKAKLHKSEKAICYDPTDLGVIWVAAPHTPRDPVPAWGTRRAYQEGLTLSEHLQLQAKLAADGKAFDDHDAHLALLHLRQRMSEDHDKFMADKRKRGPNKQESPAVVSPYVEPTVVEEPWDVDITGLWRVDGS